MPAPEICLSDLRTALIVKPSSLGDIVHTLPAVHFLKRSAPDLEVKWLVNSEWRPLLEANPDVNEIVEFPRHQFRGIRGSGKAVTWLWGIAHSRRLHADAVLDFQGLLRSAVISRASRCPYRVGLADAREGARAFYTHRVDVSTELHAVDRLRRLVAFLGADTSGECCFPLPDGAEVKLLSAETFVALHPFSRGRGKSMTPAQVNRFCRELGVPVVLVGRCGASSLAALSLPGGVVNLLNRTTIPELIWILRRARFTVSVDSGPMHLAAAVRPRLLLSIHTWSDPRKVGPYHPEAQVWKAGTILPRGEVSARLAEAAVPFGDADVKPLTQWVADALAAVREGT